MEKHIVVFDGTSAFVIPKEEMNNNWEIIFSSDDFEEASQMADEYNETV